MWLLDPRPNLATITAMVERGFELSEASNTPVMMELRIRACHVRGCFPRKKNLAPAVSTLKLDGPPKEFIYDRLAHPPATFRQEKLKSTFACPRRGASSPNTSSTRSFPAPRTSASWCRAACTTR